MKLGQMFPPTSLKGEMLPRRPVVVRIEEVDYRLGTDDSGNPEPYYLMFLEGWPKPMYLNKTNAHTIAQLVGSDETEDWRGRTISIRPAAGNHPDGRPCVTIQVDMVAPTSPPELTPPPETAEALGGNWRPALARGMAGHQAGGYIDATATPSEPAAQPPPTQQLPADFDMASMGEAMASRVVEALKRRGLNWEAMLIAMKREAPAFFEVTFGVETADVPKGVCSWIVGFLESHPVADTGAPTRTPPAAENPAYALSAPSPPPAASVSLEPEHAPPPPGDPPHDPMTEDDIPF